MLEPSLKYHTDPVQSSGRTAGPQIIFPIHAVGTGSLVKAYITTKGRCGFKASSCGRFRHTILRTNSLGAQVFHFSCRSGNLDVNYQPVGTSCGARSLGKNTDGEGWGGGHRGPQVVLCHRVQFPTLFPYLFPTSLLDGRS